LNRSGLNLTESLSENDETYCHGNCFKYWHSCQPLERMTHESNGNRFSLFWGENSPKKFAP
jgi:hypothetical protein